MTQSFKVGEIAIGCNHTLDTEYNGMECEIIGELSARRTRWTDGRITEEPVYDVRWADGRMCHCAPNRLRRKPPKQSTDEWATEQVAKVTKPVAQPEGVPA